MIELGEELKFRKDRWRSLGYLLPNDNTLREKEFDFKIFGREWIAEIRKSSSGYWETFIANGSVHTTAISFHKVRYITEKDDVLEAKQIVFFRWIMTWASWNAKTGEQ